jgi:hypothetical protein
LASAELEQRSQDELEALMVEELAKVDELLKGHITDLGTTSIT